MTNVILILIAALPLYVIRFSFFSIPSTLLEIMSLILVTIFLLKEKFSSRRFPFDIELLLWLAIGFAAASITSFSLSSLGIWRAYFFEPALLFIIFIHVFNNKRKYIQTGLALAVSAIVISLIAIYQYLTGHFIPNPSWVPLAVRRVTSIFPFPNAVGLYLAPITMFLVGVFCGILARIKKVGISASMKKELILVGAGIVLSVIAILLARSEGAIFALAISGLVALHSATKKTRMIAHVLALIVVISIIASPKIKDYVIDRVTLNNFSGQVRKIQWHETWKMLKDGRLFTGAGLANYQTVIKPYHQEGFFYNRDKLAEAEFLARVHGDPAYRANHWQPLEIYLYPHNIVLNFWSELGILGLLLFAWIIVRYFYIGIIAYRKARAANDPFAWVIFGLLFSMLVIIIHGIVDVPYFKNDLAIMFWLFIALMSVAPRL